MREELVSVTETVRGVATNGRATQIRDVADLIDPIEEVSREFAHLIHGISCGDAELRVVDREQVGFENAGCLQ
jgi:hypothetical protein